ncbi:amidase family protein [Methylorubrum extorquens]
MPQSQASALRDVVRATYRRAGLDKSETELEALLPTVRPLIDFDPREAREADIVGLLGKLTLRDASLPAAPGPVSLVRTLSKEPLAAYGGTALDITTKSATELAALLASGTITSREIVLQYMYKIQKLDRAGPALRSVTELNPELLTIADWMDARRAEAKAKGETLPDLFGIPILLKNNIETGDHLRTTASSMALIGSKPAADAPLVSNLREQGAIIMGKTNMSEWANFRGGIVLSGQGGTAINPFGPDRPLYGSSVGSGIAVAMDFAPLTVGTETNGSITSPSTGYHIWGLKLTRGLVDGAGIIPGVASLDTPGPMGSNPSDLALMLNGMRGSGTSGPANPPTDYTSKMNGDLTGVRIGVDTTDASPAFVALLSAAATGSGATLVTYNKAAYDQAVYAAVRGLDTAEISELVKLYNGLAPSTAVTQAQIDAFLKILVTDMLNQWYTAFPLSTAIVNAYGLISAYELRKYIDENLGAREANPQDYDSALVRLLGTTFRPLSGDGAKFARDLPDVVAFNAANPEIERVGFGFDTFVSVARLSLDDLVRSSGFDSAAALEAAAVNWKGIIGKILHEVRAGLGVDVSFDTRFDENAMAFANSPQLVVPVGPGRGSTGQIMNADPFGEEAMLRVGYALNEKLNDPAFASLRALSPSIPETGFANQPVDRGPLLPLVLHDLDDHGRATLAHLLTTEMAPLVLHTTGKLAQPTFDGRISGNGGLIKEADGVQALTGDSDFTGTVQVWKGALAIDRNQALGSAANAVSLEAGSALIASRSLTLARDLLLKNGGSLGAGAEITLIADGVISGNGGLTKTGAGQLTLTGANTYTGGTRVAEGVLAVAADAGLGQDYGALRFAAETGLLVTGSFATQRPFQLDGETQLSVRAGASLTVNNLIDGTGGLVLDGGGSLTLAAAANRFAGGIQLKAGTLALDGAGAAGLGPIRFEAGPQTLVLDAAAFQSGVFGGTIARFGTADTISLADLAYTAGATAQYDPTAQALTVVSGGLTRQLTLSEVGRGGFTLASDPAGGTRVLLTGVPVGLAASGPGLDAQGNGLLKAGAVLSFTVEMSDLVTVETGAGRPVLVLSNGAEAAYTGQPNGGSLGFAYTVAPGQDSQALTVARLDLRGAVIRDAGGHVADVTALPAAPSGTITLDTTAPTLALTAAPPASVEASSAAGAAVSFAASAGDGVDPAPRVVFRAGDSVVSSGQTFALGTHSVTATAFDAAGNASAPVSFDFTVQDSTAPTLALTAAPPTTVEASSAAGAAVSFTASAGDGVDPAPRVVFRAGDAVVSSGQTFAIGTHSVTATAFDAAGNASAPVSFSFTVQDSTAPTLAVAAAPPTTIEASSAAGAAVSFAVSAGDGVDPAPRVVFRSGDAVVSSGQTFALGTHSVTATAFDAAGNASAPVSFDFTVQDSIAPTLTLTAAPPATVEASSAAGAAVSFAASAGDGVDPAPRVVFRAGDTVVSSGQTFALGTHSVTATAFDAAGNASAPVSFDFTVTTPVAPATASFDFALSQASLRQAPGHIALIGPDGLSHDVTAVETFVFTDGVVRQKDAAPLVDDLFYYAANPDVWQAQIDADAHYAAYGWREGRDPNAAFSTGGYLAANPEVAAAGLDPLVHFAQTGWKEGRDPAAGFDVELYLARHPEARAAGLDPLSHYLAQGRAEGLAAHAAIGRPADLAEQGGFDAQAYLLSNLDVAEAAWAAGGDSFAFARTHYTTYGWQEGRNPNAVFDTKGYLAAYGDVAAAGVDPLAHYVRYGAAEGRDPSAGFDGKAYLAANSDVAAAGLNPMLHYLQYGAVEGRSVFADGHFA